MSGRASAGTHIGGVLVGRNGRAWESRMAMDEETTIRSNMDQPSGLERAIEECGG